jgi:hypothetical protein
MIYPNNLVSKFVDYFNKQAPGSQTKNFTENKTDKNIFENDPGAFIATCKIKRWDFEKFEKT